MSNWFQKSAAPIEEIPEQQAQENPTVTVEEALQDPGLVSMIEWFKALDDAMEFQGTAWEQFNQKLNNLGITVNQLPDEVQNIFNANTDD